MYFIPQGTCKNIEIKNDTFFKLIMKKNTDPQFNNSFKRKTWIEIDTWKHYTCIYNVGTYLYLVILFRTVKYSHKMNKLPVFGFGVFFFCLLGETLTRLRSRELR